MLNAAAIRISGAALVLMQAIVKEYFVFERSLVCSGILACEFNSWLADATEWLKDYQLKNVVVFNYYNILTGDGASDVCAYPTGRGYDSHPATKGNRKAAGALCRF